MNARLKLKLPVSMARLFLQEPECEVRDPFTLYDYKVKVHRVESYKCLLSETFSQQFRFQEILNTTSSTFLCSCYGKL